MTTTITDLDAFKALDPFFRIIEKGLEGNADGGHFFDLLAGKVIFDYTPTTFRDGVFAVPPAMFDKAGTALWYSDYPPNDRPPSYPCPDCPSSRQ